MSRAGGRGTARWALWHKESGRGQGCDSCGAHSPCPALQQGTQTVPQHCTSMGRSAKRKRGWRCGEREKKMNVGNRNAHRNPTAHRLKGQALAQLWKLPTKDWRSPPGHGCSPVPLHPLNSVGSPQPGISQGEVQGFTHKQMVSLLGPICQATLEQLVSAVLSRILFTFPSHP